MCIRDSYKDTFRDDILALVDRKVQAGMTEEVMEVETPRETRASADILDLSDLLKRSLGRGAKGKPAARAAASDDSEEQDAAPAKRRAAAKKATRRTTGTATRKSTSGGASRTARKRRAA